MPKILNNIDLVQNQLQNAVVHADASFPSTPLEGQIFYKTGDKKLYVYRGSTKQWRELGDIDTISMASGDENVVTVGLSNGDITLTLATNATPVSGSTLLVTDAAGDLNLTGGTINIDGDEVATQAYVDAVSSGLDVKDSVRMATTQDLAAETFGTTGVTYDNGTAGVGATLTQDDATDGAFTGVDAVATPIVGDRILVKDQTSALENGIYEVTTIGDGATIPWVLTRTTDADENGKITGGTFTFVEEGNDYDNKGFVVSTDGTIVIGTTGISWTQFSGAGSLTAGAGLSQSNNTINVNFGDGIKNDTDNVAVDLVSDGGLEISTNQLQVDLATSSGLEISTGLKINVDATTGTTEINGSGEIAVPTGGIDTAQIATDAVTATEIEAGAVDTSELATGAVTTAKLDTTGTASLGGGTVFVAKKWVGSYDGDDDLPNYDWTSNDIVVTHSLGTEDIAVTIIDQDGEVVYPTVDILSTNTVQIQYGGNGKPSSIQTHKIIITA